jgi:serine/threonine protein kinase
MNLEAGRDQAALEALVGQVADEFTQRLNRGERPSVDEYVERHPEIASVLREVLPALGLLRRPDVGAALADGDPNLTQPLGDFQLIREIGHGGMGVVYEARQLSLNRRVAVKILPFAAALDPRRLQRFKTEALAAARLHHEHIVPVYFVGCERGVHFYAMQYIEGWSLSAIIAELRRMAGAGPGDPQQTMPYAALGGTPGTAEADTSPLTMLTTEGSARSPAYLRTVARLILEAALGLEHAHQEMVWHRDIKPANLLVDNRGSLWIADFGLAQMRSDTPLTVTGELVGTIRYMSPEQALAKRVPVDQRTDIYSLGATLYELLTLRPVFAGKDRQELLRQVAFEDPRPPRRLSPEVHRDLEAVCMKCLEKDPKRRYPSARALADDLRRWLAGEPTVARPLSRAGRVRRFVRRRPMLTAIGALLVAAAMILPVAAYYLDPDRVARDNLAKLNRGEAVTLIGPVGPPRWMRNVIGAPEVVASPAHDGAFSLNSRNRAYVELLPVAPARGYRFRIQVRHDDPSGGANGDMGVYLLRSEVATGNGIEHAFCVVRFSEWHVSGVDPAGQPVGRVVLELRRRRVPQRFNGAVEAGPSLLTPIVANKPKVLPPWHDVAIDVTDASVALSWDGKSVGAIARVQLAQTFYEELNHPANPRKIHEPALSPSFLPTGGLGIFVETGWASFRAAVVEPLDEGR